MLFRKAEKQIDDWIENGRNALLVSGVRQAGKSFLIHHCLAKSGRSFFEMNLLNDAALAKSLNESAKKGAEETSMVLQIAAGHPLEKGTIVFLDEIQEAPELVTVIKFLVLKNQYRFILSGSLLGIELKNIRSAPVGFLTYIDLYPLDLEEWYIASGLGEEVFSLLRDCFANRQPVPDSIHQALIDSFYLYLLVGGMPSAVDEYFHSQDVGRVGAIQSDIIRLYKSDFTKYEAGSRLYLNSLYDLIPTELLKGNRRYVIDDLNKPGLKYKNYVRLEEGFEWLRSAGVAVPCLNAREFVLPLLGSVKHSLFKLFLSDVGLLTRQYGRSTALSILGDRDIVNLGALFENFAANELDKHGFPLYYVNSKSRGELDFVIEKDGALLPIEIKSGSSYKTHKALDNFYNEYREAMVFSPYNVETEGKIIYYPIYMLMFLDNRDYGFSAPGVDLSSLNV